MQCAGAGRWRLGGLRRSRSTHAQSAIKRTSDVTVGLAIMFSKLFKMAARNIELSDIPHYFMFEIQLKSIFFVKQKLQSYLRGTIFGKR